jgi:hypothetical protein
MSWSIRCRCCGVLYAPERHEVVAQVTRLCPRCRGPLPPTGSVPVADGAAPLRRSPHPGRAR